jgi:cytochrome c biogenesis protein CcmG/thiol:disulfide interchange protein DsbE
MSFGEMRRSSGRWLIACALLACFSLATAQTAKSLMHKKAPEFVRTDLRGEKIDVARYRGKVVLLNFWATWCAPCQMELPKFESWQKTYGAEGLQVLAVSMDDGDVPVRRTVHRLHLNYPVMMGDAKLGEEYGGVLGLPVTFLIDRDGRVAAKIKGEADLHALESQLKELLSAGAAK